MWLLAILPFPVLYALSDFIYFWLYHVIGYRRKVVGTNLKNSFPEKSAAELKAIERKFYHYLCDYMLEDVAHVRERALQTYDLRKQGSLSPDD